MKLRKQLSFEAAHFLPNVPEGHKCGRMHGHSFRVIVHVDGPVDTHAGWVMDFADISKVIKPIINMLDHRTLNEIEGLENPTSENLSIWIWNKLSSALPSLAAVEVEETCTSGCVYCGDLTTAGTPVETGANKTISADPFPLAFAPLDDVSEDETVLAVVKELDAWRPSNDELSEIVAVTARTLDTVSRLTQYEDEKANRILAAIAFVSAFVGALFGTIPSRFPPTSIALLWASGIHWRSALLASSYLLFSCYALLVAIGLAMVLWAVTPRFKTSAGWKAAAAIANEPGWKKDLTKRPKSLLFYERIAETHPTMWAREFSVNSAYDIELTYAKNSIAESHLVSDKIRYKVKWLTRGVRLFFCAAIIVSFLIVSVVMNLVVTPLPPEHPNTVVVNVQQPGLPSDTSSHASTSASKPEAKPR